MSELHLSWMVGERIVGIEVGQFRKSIFTFSGGGALHVYCPWRLLRGGTISVSSVDDGEQFGVAPVNAASEVSRTLRDKTVEQVIVAGGTSDINVQFGTDLELQIIALSSGFEAWSQSAQAAITSWLSAAASSPGFRRPSGRGRIDDEPQFHDFGCPV